MKEIKDLLSDFDNYKDAQESTIVFEDAIKDDNTINLGENDIKEEFIEEKKEENKKKNKKIREVTIVHKVIVGILLFSISISYFYIFNDKNNSKGLAKVPTSNVVKENENNKKSTDKSTDTKNTPSSMKVSDFKESTEKNISIVKEETILKINAYLDLKANRMSTLDVVKKNMDKISNYYYVLKENESAFKNDEETYNYLDELIIKNIAMREEMILAFDDKPTKKILNEIIERYK